MNGRIYISHNQPDLHDKIVTRLKIQKEIKQMRKLTSRFLSVVRGSVDGPGEEVSDLNWKRGYHTMQMRKRVFLRSFLAVFFFMSGRPAMLHGAHWSESLAFTYDNGLGDTMPYRLFIPPDYDPERAGERRCPLSRCAQCPYVELPEKTARSRG